MDIAKELDEMGRRAGGDGRAILTIEACTRGDADSYAEGDNPVKTIGRRGLRSLSAWRAGAVCRLN
jgi:hypothetical protein